MQIIKLIPLLVLMSSVSDADDIVFKENKSFQYELVTTDVLSWVNGERTGPVRDEKGVAAETLDKYMSRSRRNIQMAIYGTEKQKWFLDKVKELKGDGIEIRAVVDQKAGELGEWKANNFVYPMTAKLPKILGARAVVPDVDQHMNIRISSFMHNKFFVFDNSSVWTGSTNISHTCLGAEYNANVAIVIKSPMIAEIFSQEFQQMYTDKRFSSKKQALGGIPVVKFADGTDVKVLFSPQDDPVANGILPAIRGAKRTLNMALFYFTEQSIADEVLAAHRRGVEVRLIIDSIGARNSGSKHDLLRRVGIDVRVESWGGKMHMKSASIDSDTVIIGSMNWSNAGNVRNDENVLIIEDNRKLNDEFNLYYSELWASLDAPINQDMPRAEGHQSTNSCVDSLNNDYDWATDGRDPDCQM
jgi:phosphatidylserine/phosphatidylglycerophosphate/cardiolipin synthase-like enzyme